MMPMRVMVAHNSYQFAGGEDSVVADEIQLLRRKGHHVIEMRRDNMNIDGFSHASLMFQTLWSAATRQEAIELLDEHQPAVVHVHNTFPLLSPSIYWACAKKGVPVVQTLHNFRLTCPGAMLLRDGKVCEKCVGQSPLPALIHKCYRNSRSHTAVAVGMIMLHRAIQTYQRKITRYIALNEFCRVKFIEAGLPGSLIAIKPNFADVDYVGDSSERKGFLFVGRLSPEKGVKVLKDAWINCPHATLRVAGCGPDATLINVVPGVTLLGSLAPALVRKEMRSARALVLPSIWYENFPRTVVEAYGSGLPVIASRIGALEELVEHGVTGLLFEPGNSCELSSAINWATSHPFEMAIMGENARRRFESLYTPDINYHRLIEIYSDAVDANKNIT